MTKPLRILWVSNAPWCKTGYGVQTAHGVRSLRQLGAEIGIFAYYGVEGAITQADGGDGVSERAAAVRQRHGARARRDV
jgi:hypothetical protein